VDVTVDAELEAKLRAMARQHDLTLNTVVQGAWALVLSRLSGRRDVVFGAVGGGGPAGRRGVGGPVGGVVQPPAGGVPVGWWMPGSRWGRCWRNCRRGSRR